MPREYPDRASVADMLEAAELIRTFVAGLDRDDFLSDRKTQSAVVMQLLILGEAAKRISLDLLQRTAHVDWIEVMRTRDKLVHHYEGWDLVLIWKMTQKSVPQLREQLRALLDQL